jgi:hypothetical protein
MKRRDDLPARIADEGLTPRGAPAGRARVAACVVLTAALLVSGCGGGDDDGSTSRTATYRTYPDTAGLPDYMRKSVACWRGVGVDVRVPAAVRRLVKRGEFKGETPQGVETGFLSFLLFDKKQEVTQAQFRAARRCYDTR